MCAALVGGRLPKQGGRGRLEECMMQVMRHFGVRCDGRLIGGFEPADPVVRATVPQHERDGPPNNPLHTYHKARNHFENHLAAPTPGTPTTTNHDNHASGDCAALDSSALRVCVCKQLPGGKRRGLKAKHDKYYPFPP